MLSAVLLTGCSSPQSERQAVSEALTVRSKALNSRDAAQYISVLSADYNHNGKDYFRIKESLISNFQTFESISYQPAEMTISLHGKYAEAVGAYRMRVVVRNKELVLDGTEHLQLAKEPEGWKIIGGL